jgi:protein lysine acetyltransferase
MSARAPPAEPAQPAGVVGSSFLADATEVWIRPVQSSDRDLVRSFLASLSPSSLAERYFEAIRPEVAERSILSATSAPGRLCLLALADVDDEVRLLGIGEFATQPSDPSVAEVAFLVAEGSRGAGVASRLFARLARAARAAGVRTFEARVLEGNTEMIAVLRTSGRPYIQLESGGEIDLRVALPPAEGSAPDRPRHRWLAT